MKYYEKVIQLRESSPKRRKVHPLKEAKYFMNTFCFQKS